MIKIQNSKDPSPQSFSLGGEGERERGSLEHWNLGFRYCFGFRDSGLGFHSRKILLIVLILGIFIGFWINKLIPEEQASAKLVTIKSRNLEYQVVTKAQTVEDLLDEQGYVDRHKVVTNSDSGLKQGTIVEVNVPVDVVINDGGAVREITTTAQTVSDLIYEQEIALAETDRVSTNINEDTHGYSADINRYLADGMTVYIDRIVDIEETRVAVIPFERKLQYDPALLYGREERVQEGREGEKSQDFLVTYENGIEIKKILLAETLIQEPIPEIRRFGTKIEVESVEEGRASWYAYMGCMCAAHPYAEKGKFVRVTSLSSGKSIIVRVNDRGPDQAIHPERVIDLDSVAFEKLAPLGAGTVEVRVEVIKSQ